MGLGRGGRGPIGWWSPDPRGVLPLDGAAGVPLAAPRPGRGSRSGSTPPSTTVVAACADPTRPGRWITDAVARGLPSAARLGWAHSVECWRDGRLVGGLYGVAVGGLFAGESMFHRRDRRLQGRPGRLGPTCCSADGDPRRLLDVQWQTPHLAGLGVVEVTRTDYLDRLEAALCAAALHLVSLRPGLRF